MKTDRYKFIRASTIPISYIRKPGVARCDECARVNIAFQRAFAAVGPLTWLMCVSLQKAHHKNCSDGIIFKYNRPLINIL